MAHDEKMEMPTMEKAMTAKQIKKLAKPEFAANPDKFYPTKTLRKMGFERASCPTCKNNYWRHSPKRTTCGDSQCEKKYSFIGVGTGKGRTGKKITYADAWNGFKKSLSSARIPCTPIPRYPVVARWRADVDYVAAGIFCFQPYCVTGELEPPANPLICPQFCLRFNDLDNIGLTGRHYSGFIMLGIQVFNLPDKYKFWMDECVEFNYRWLTEELGIDPDEITFIEDVWAGGGNLGPSIEYFVNGLELGNMVFMQFKTFPDGKREPLKVQVIDVGIGLERVPWLINGSPTSYVDVFPTALNYLLGKLDLRIDSDVWSKYGPLSCLLNADEVEDLDKTWEFIGGKIGMKAADVKKAIEPIRDAYIVLDHTRTVLMAVTDGSLPSNVGGASNVRNILRRVFAVLARRGWWDKLGMKGFLELFEKHKVDLATIYGPFDPYPSFGPVIELEYERWRSTGSGQITALNKILKQRKDGKLTIDDWIVLMESHGLPEDIIAKESKQEVPGNLYVVWEEKKESLVVAQPAVLYSTEDLPETKPMYYLDNNLFEFNAKIIAVFPNVQSNNTPSIVILDQSVFYPTSGGQEHDTGMLRIDGREYKVVDAMKVGPCVLHVIEPPLPERADLNSWKGVTIFGKVDKDRRDQLRNNHTATHIVYSSCRKVLGEHVWQHGAKKSFDQAHLDITHFKSLSNEEVVAIQTEANRVVQRCKEINKGFMPKDEAEKKYGFHLYQGGVVPGNELRVVDINGTDTEACCGTHCDNTAEVGCIKILKTGRVSDGIVRLYYVAGENALKAIQSEESILRQLVQTWQISTKEDIVPTGARFFDGYKKGETRMAKQAKKILELHMKAVLLDDSKNVVFRVDEPVPSIFIALMPQYSAEMKAKGKNVAYVGTNFAYLMLGDGTLNTKEFEEFVQKDFEEGKDRKDKKNKREKGEKKGDKEEKEKKPEKSSKASHASVEAKEKQDADGGAAGKDKGGKGEKGGDKKVKTIVRPAGKGKDDSICVTVTNLATNNTLVEYLISKGFQEDEY